MMVNPAAHLEDVLGDPCKRNDEEEEEDRDDDDVGYGGYIEQLTEASCTPQPWPPNSKPRP